MSQGYNNTVVTMEVSKLCGGVRETAEDRVRVAKERLMRSQPVYFMS